MMDAKRIAEIAQDAFDIYDSPDGGTFQDEVDFAIKTALREFGEELAKECDSYITESREYGIEDAVAAIRSKVSALTGEGK